MGQCCGGELNKSEVNLLISKYAKLKSKQQIKSRNHYLMSSNNPIINFDIEKNNLSYAINDLLIRYNFSDINRTQSNLNIINERNSNIEKLIEKIRIDQLWNLTIFYKDNFTDCDYIIYDLRKNIKQSFLFKYKKINYSLNDIISNSDNKDFNKKMKNFLDLKKIIILIDSEEKILLIEDFISFCRETKINCSFKILDTDLNKEASVITSSLSELLDKRNAYLFPLILCSLQYFPHMNSNKIIFLEKNYILNLESISEMKEDLFDFKEDFQELIESFHISQIYLITNKKDVKYNLSIKSKEENPMFYYLTSAFIIEEIDSIESLIKRKENFSKLIRSIFKEIGQGNSILILIDNSISIIDSKLYIFIIFFFICNILQLNKSQLLCLLKDNPVFPVDSLIIIEKYKKQYEEFMNIKEESSKSKIKNLINSNIINNLSNNNDHSISTFSKNISHLLYQLNLNTSEKEFLIIVNTIEKIIQNVINNSKNPKYFRIRSESNTFKTYFRYTYSISILEEFGFILDESSQDLNLNLEADINNLEILLNEYRINLDHHVKSSI